MKKKTKKLVFHWKGEDDHVRPQEINGIKEEDAYRQINRTSFQHNFSVLIGHYKHDGRAPQVG